MYVNTGFSCVYVHGFNTVLKFSFQLIEVRGDNFLLLEKRQLATQGYLTIIIVPSFKENDELFVLGVAFFPE